MASEKDNYKNLKNLLNSKFISALLNYIEQNPELLTISISKSNSSKLYNKNLSLAHIIGKFGTVEVL